MINRSQIARIIFNEAAAMGIADRQVVEKLTSQVIQRLEQPPMLPGMEHLMPRAPAQVVQHTSDADILAVVREFLSVE